MLAELKQRQMYTLERTQRLPISVEEAWKFFQSPENLAAITPDYMGFNILSETPDEMYPGLFIHYKVSPLLGIKMHWTTEITHVEAPTYFVDDQRVGPYSIWHHEHHFKAIEGGVEMLGRAPHQPRKARACNIIKDNDSLSGLNSN